MDGELLSDPSVSDTSSVGGDGDAVTSSYTEMFNSQFPYYLSIGMTAEQYWDEDATLPIYYRKAEKLRMEKQNQYLWLQGMYVYDAISRLSPILRAFAKKGTRAEPYTPEPYPLSNESKEKAKEREEKAKMEQAKRRMDMFAANTNQRFREMKKNGG